MHKFFSRKYDFNNYNCAHFAAEIWKELTSDDISHLISGFVQVNKPKKGDIAKLKQFRRLDGPKSPCIVLFQNRYQEPHIGVFIDNQVLHIQEQGVQYQPLNVASFGYNRISFYDI